MKKTKKKKQHRQVSKKMKKKGPTPSSKANVSPIKDLNFSNLPDHQTLVLANNHYEAGNLDQARTLLTQIIQQNPNNADALNLLGSILAQQDHTELALNALRQAIAIKPDFVEAYNNLGSALKEAGQFHDSLKYFKKATELRPDFTIAYYNLANSLMAMKHYQEALDYFKKILTMEPNHLLANRLITSAYFSTGQYEEAKQQLEKLAVMQPDEGGVAFSCKTLLPMIIESREAMETALKEYSQNLDSLLQENIQFDEPVTNYILSSFYLAYQDINLKDYQVKLAEALAKACPSINFTASHCQPGHQRKPGKPRIGFFSRYFYDHPVGHCYRQFIEYIDKEGNCDVLLITTYNTNKDDYFYKLVEQCSHHLEIPEELEKAHTLIAEKELDILFYPDVGMDPFTYFLAFSRLAPVQCVSSGHPVTTGINTLDYYISNTDMEPSNGQEHYNEKLIELKNTPAIHTKPEMPENFKTRTELGLAEDRNIYLCPVRLQKIHPDFDAALLRILEQDPAAEIILFQDFQGLTWHETIRRRMASIIPEELLSHIHFLPWIHEKTDFYHMLNTANVILDPFHFGLGSTCYAIFAVGTPIVTWPANYMRGRVTYKLYTMMGVDTPIAKDQEEYSRLAVEIATNAETAEHTKQEILANNAIIYNNDGTAHEMLEFFNSVTTA